MSPLAQALLAELTDEDLRVLADKLKPLLGPRSDSSDPWLDVAAAAAYIKAPKSRIYALVSAGRIPHHKDGSRTLLRRDELDEWLRAGGATRP